jgi:hypothetical protein
MPLTPRMSGQTGRNVTAARVASACKGDPRSPGLLRKGCASPFPRSSFRPDVTCGPWRPAGVQ